MRCNDLAGLWLDEYAKRGCCRDCHAEEAAGHARLQPRTLPDGRTVLVCCGGAFFIGRLRERAEHPVA
jgi:hypothetical protein